LNPHTVFITGVSSGLGLGLARHYLAAGALVYGISRRPAPIDHPRFHFHVVDLADHSQIPSLIRRLDPPLATLETTVLNAGQLGTLADLRETTLEDLQHLMAVNVWANKLLIDGLLSHLNVKQIVTISSGAAVNANRGWSGYSISKAALNTMTKTYAAEAPNTHFAAVAPGLVDTAMQDYLCNLDDPRFTSLEKIKSKRHSPEMPTPDELAPRLAALIARLPSGVASGSFVDIRQLPEELAQLSN